METIYTYKWYDIKVDYDELYNPRKEEENIWTMLCAHNRYSLWDIKLETYWESFKDDMCRYLWVTESVLNKEYIYLPLYLYDHGGIHMNTTWYGCRWDSWMVWYIYVSKKKARESLQKNNDSDIKNILHIRNTLKILEQEVDIYSKYLKWEIYCYNILDTEESYWWFFSKDEAYEEAKITIDNFV